MLLDPVELAEKVAPVSLIGGAAESLDWNYQSSGWAQWAAAFRID